MTKRMLALVLVLMMAVSCLAACGSKDTTSTTTKTETKKEDTTTSTTEEEGGEEYVATLPLTDEAVTLSMFIGSDANLTTTGMNWEDTDYFQEMEKRTGVHIEFQIPAAGEDTTAYNLMIASGELTDLISSGYGGTYQDGLDAAVEDGYYVLETRGNDSGVTSPASWIQKYMVSDDAGQRTWLMYTDYITQGNNTRSLVWGWGSPVNTVQAK